MESRTRKSQTQLGDRLLTNSGIVEIRCSRAKAIVVKRETWEEDHAYPVFICLLKFAQNGSGIGGRHVRVGVFCERQLCEIIITFVFILFCGGRKIKRNNEQINEDDIIRTIERLNNNKE